VSQPDRRTWLKATGLWLGGALVGGTARAGPDASGALADFHALAGEATRIAGRSEDESRRRVFREEGLPDDHFRGALAAALVLMAWRDLPRAAQEDDEAQRMASRAASTVGRACLRTLRVLQRADARGELSWDPGAARVFRDAVRSGSGGEQRERVDHLERMLEGVSWRLERQGPSAVLRGWTRTLDKVSLKAGLDPADWDAALAVEPAGKPPRIGEQTPWGELTEDQRLAVIGAALMGMGGAYGIGAVFLMARGMWVLLAGGPTLAVILLITGGVMLARNRSKVDAAGTDWPDPRPDWKSRGQEP
jgi:hypothetical protein